MRKSLKKLLSISLVAMLTLQAPFSQAFTWAEPVTQKADSAAGINEDAESDGILYDTVDTVERDSVSSDDLDAIGQDTENQEDAGAKSPESEVPETESAGTAETQPLLNYIYISEIYQQSQADGNVIVASLGDDDTQLSDVTLGLVDVQTGQAYELTSNAHTGNAYEFMTKDANLAKGIYRIAEISYLSENGTSVLSMEEIPGMENTVFGVQKDPEIPADELVSLESLGDADALASELAVQAQTLLDEGAADMENLVSIDVTDLSGAADSIAERLRAASMQPNLSADVQVLSERSAIPKVQSDALAAETAKSGAVVIFLDPGHDQTHAGARANGINEEDINLKVAQYCKDYLTATYSNVIVYMSRSTAACPHPGLSSGDDNKARVADAQKVGADAYVSIHFNSAAASSSGAMVFYPNSNYNSAVGQSGSALASKILEQLVKLGLKNNGIKIRNSESGDTYDDGSLADYYGVIRAAKKAGIPGVIVEHAFLTNASDAAFLKSEENLKKLALADATGIANAFSLSTEVVEFSSESLDITDIDGANGSFKMTVTGASPVESISAIKFNVYPSSDKSASYEYTAQPDEDEEGTYSVIGNVSNHDMETGKYKVTAYAYDASGKKTKLSSTTFTINKTSVSKDAMKLSISRTSNQKKVTMTLKKNDGAAEVYFKVYNNKIGSKKTKKYKASKAATGWKASFKITDFKAGGDYTVMAYSKTFYGKTTKVKQGSFTIDGPTMKSVTLTKIDMDKGTFRIKANKVNSASSIKQVKIKVKNLGGDKRVAKTYTAKKSASSSYYYTNVNFKDFNYELGEYQITVTANDGNGISKTFSKVTYEFEDAEPVVGAKLKSNKTKLQMSAANLGIGATVSNVRFIVSHAGGQTTKKYYMAKNKNGVWSTSLKVSDLGTTGTYKVQAYVKGLNGKYTKAGKVQRVTISSLDGAYTAIAGENGVTVDQLVAYYNANATYPSYYKQSDASTLKQFCTIYYNECKAENIKVEVAFAQAMKETGFLHFGGDVSIEQYNFAGIGATGGGAAGNSFSSVTKGIRAQIQHLKAYASKESLTKKCVDPRFSLVSRGTAPYVEWLGIQENPYKTGWAADQNYGASILQMIASIKKY